MGSIKDQSSQEKVTLWHWGIFVLIDSIYRKEVYIRSRIFGLLKEIGSFDTKVLDFYSFSYILLLSYLLFVYLFSIRNVSLPSDFCPFLKKKKKREKKREGSCDSVTLPEHTDILQTLADRYKFLT